MTPEADGERQLGDDGTRVWGGRTLAVRQAERRRRLLDAGFELLGTEGAGAVTVRGVVRRARLSERFFYENFADRETLLLAVHDEVAAQARAVIAAAVERSSPASERLPVVALDAFTDFLEDDPRRGRVLLLEAFANETLARNGVALVPSFAALLIEQITARVDAPDAVDAQISAVALVGALTHLYLGWLDGSLPVERERLVAHAARLIEAVSLVVSH